MNNFNLGWPEVAAIIGSLTIIASFLFKYIKKPDNQFKDELQKIEVKIVELRASIEQLSINQTTLTNELNYLTDQVDKLKDNFEKKIEKLTDLVIQFVSNK